MLGKNLLWIAKQHGHSVEVMLRMYAAWLEGATESDIHAITTPVLPPHYEVQCPDCHLRHVGIGLARRGRRATA
jgi:hypothetical protein